MANTPHEKATPAITVVASESLVITRHPAQAHAGALSRRVTIRAARNLTWER
jgi:hypothetical protein